MFDILIASYRSEALQTVLLHLIAWIVAAVAVLTLAQQPDLYVRHILILCVICLPTSYVLVGITCVISSLITHLASVIYRYFLEDYWNPTMRHRDAIREARGPKKMNPIKKFVISAHRSGHIKIALELILSLSIYIMVTLVLVTRGDWSSELDLVGIFFFSLILSLPISGLAIVAICFLLDLLKATYKAFKEVVVDPIVLESKILDLEEAEKHAKKGMVTEVRK